MKVQPCQSCVVGFGSKQVDYAKVLKENGINFHSKGGSIIVNGAIGPNGRRLSAITLLGKKLSPKNIFDTLVHRGVILSKKVAG